MQQCASFFAILFLDLTFQKIQLTSHIVIPGLRVGSLDDFTRLTNQRHHLLVIGFRNGKFYLHILNDLVGTGGIEPPTHTGILISMANINSYFPAAPTTELCSRLPSDEGIWNLVWSVGTFTPPCPFQGLYRFIT